MSERARTRLAIRLARLLPERLARRFVRDQKGATAVEFALVALPFFALLFAILETALVFFAGQTLETAAAEASRLIMTGQAQTASYSQQDFKKAVCDRIYGLFDCANGVYVDVKQYSSFGAVNNTAPVANGNFDTTKMTYVPGGPGCIEVVTLYYQWPIYVSLLGNNLSNLNGNYRLLVATSVFRNEPYATSGGC
ncbi:pilus assembly protein [Pseudolabrys taiwanensis]|uniref:Pilus assembly protein n=1 Tax=Pseudolabrys taiwanensis TaxID=331696 RepID=A0A346A0V3_9HYPH|nr:TadE/TadG family type IV pilus assembly protein [Pseudolabrys taiwanensis]AXK82800.1 pilus assembly protein [Pseudolabrys taiwanensis]